MIKHQQVHGKATKTQRQTKLSNVSMGIGELQPISSKNPPGRQKNPVWIRFFETGFAKSLQHCRNPMSSLKCTIFHI